MGEDSPRLSSEPQTQANDDEQERQRKIQMEQDELYARQLALRLELGIDDDEPIPNTVSLQRSLLSLDSSGLSSLRNGNRRSEISRQQRSNNESINNNNRQNDSNNGSPDENNNENDGPADQRRQTRMNAMSAMTRELRNAYINVILSLGVNIPQIIAGLIVLPLYWSNESVCTVDDNTKWKLYVVVAILRMLVKCYIVVENYRIQSYNEPLRLQTDYFHFIRSITNIEEGFALIWFIVGNMWLLSDSTAADGTGEDTSSCHPFDAPIYKLGFSFLMIQYFLLCLPCIIVILLLPVLCFCLPCLIRFMARFVDTNPNKGASEENIKKNTKICKYREILEEESMKSNTTCLQVSPKYNNGDEFDLEKGLGVDDDQHSSEDALITRKSSFSSSSSGVPSEIGSIQGKAKTKMNKENFKRRRSSGFLESALDLVSTSTKSSNNNNLEGTLLNGQEDTQDMNKPACAICIMDYELDDEVRVLPCKHYFHTDCVDSWLKMNATCPTCRANILEASNTNNTNNINNNQENTEERSTSSNNSNTTASNSHTISVNC